MQEEWLVLSEKERQTMREQLTVREAEFIRAEETIKQRQQRIWEIKQEVICFNHIIIHFGDL